MTACRAAALRACIRHSSTACATGSRKSDGLLSLSPLRYRNATFTSFPWCNVFQSDLRRYATSRDDRVLASELQFGQPLHETHPHLLNHGELTRGITASEYAQRRTALARALPPGAIAVVAAADLKYRSGAVFHAFQQDANFFYLTGFDEPEAVAVIAKPADGSDDHIFHLFVRPKDARTEMWEGARSGEQAALDVFNADETGDINKISELLRPLVQSANTIFTDIPTKPSNTNQPASLFSRFFSAFSRTSGGDSFAKLVADKKIRPLRNTMNALRSIKSPAEIAVMRATGQASGRAITAAMRHLWLTEKELAAFLAYEFNKRGCDTDAYIPVVAGGHNGLGIHYTANNAKLRPSDMVLVDAGGQMGHYITDITRTWPLGDGKRATWSPAQRDLYEAVLSVQRACVAMCSEKASVSLDRLHEIAESGLRAALKDLGFDIVSSGPGGSIMGGGGKLQDLFPHHVGHYIGLDVHDTPGLSRTDRLREGHVVTVEPGVYVPLDDERWPKHFRGLAVRIEDSIAVQAEGPLVLTTEAVKEVDDILALLGTGDSWQGAGKGLLYD